MANGNLTDALLARAKEVLEAELSDLEIRLQKDHPRLWEVLQKRVGEPLDLKIKSLIRDAVYDALKAQTDKEVDLNNLVHTILTVILRITNNLLPLLL